MHSPHGSSGEFSLPPNSHQLTDRSSNINHRDQRNYPARSSVGVKPFVYGALLFILGFGFCCLGWEFVDRPGRSRRQFRALGVSCFIISGLGMLCGFGLMMYGGF